MKNIIDFNYENLSVAAFDLDDTLTVNGQLPSEVVLGLENLQKKNITTVLVTGRGAGWADAIIKLLPFDAVVAENGSVLFYWQNKKAQRKLREEPKKKYWQKGNVYSLKPPSNLNEKRDQLSKVILSAYPRAKIASDQPYRIYDLAIDFAEEVDPPLPMEDIHGIKKLFVDNGATAKISSIHVNGWWGDFTKVNGLKFILENIFTKDIKNDVVYVGDSPNDGPLFGAAGVSVGVANVNDFVGKVDFPLPKYITKKHGGDGALEVIKKLLG